MCPRDMPFTSESVTEGHPDKLCDQIFDAVLDECLRLDPDSRVACDLLQISYCIGLADPVSVMANTFGSATLADVALVQPVRKLFPLSPRDDRSPRSQATDPPEDCGLRTFRARRVSLGKARRGRRTQGESEACVIDPITRAGWRFAW